MTKTKKTTKTVATKKTTTTKNKQGYRAKIDKVYNLLKSGKKVSRETLVKNTYGVFNKANNNNMCRLISELRYEGHDIQFVGDGKYQLQ